MTRAVLVIVACTIAVFSLAPCAGGSSPPEASTVEISGGSDYSEAIQAWIAEFETRLEEAREIISRTIGVLG